MIFRGSFEHALDAKHRLTIPSKFRAALAGGVVLAASHETNPDTPRSIAIWPAQAYEAYASAALAGISPLSPRARDLKRFFFNFSHDTELDSANRVMIPPKLMDYAGLDKEVEVVGSGSSAFASDGTVKANIVGSGEVRVIGRATCKVTSMGSGRLVCEPAASAGARPKDDQPKA